MTEGYWTTKTDHIDWEEAHSCLENEYVPDGWTCCPFCGEDRDDWPQAQVINGHTQEHEVHMACRRDVRTWVPGPKPKPITVEDISRLVLRFGNLDRPRLDTDG